MGQKLSPQDNELYRRCDEVLHYLWDPIGVRGAPGARDEYHSYLPRVFSLVRGNATVDAIADYLVTVERDRMSLSPAPDRARKVAAILIEYREWIDRAAS